MSENLTTPSELLDSFARQYLEAQLAHDRNTALSILDAAFDAGLSIPTIYLELIQPCQYELGRLWETNQISVATEHIGTGISQLGISRLYSRIEPTPSKGHSILIACVEGELHDMGARMVADLCEMHGFDVTYLGANVPTDALIETIQEKRPDVIGLSVTMSFNVPALQNAIARISELLYSSPLTTAGGRALTLMSSTPGLNPTLISRGNIIDEVRRLTVELGDGHASTN